MKKGSRKGPPPRPASRSSQSDEQPARKGDAQRRRLLSVLAIIAAVAVTAAIWLSMAKWRRRADVSAARTAPVASDVILVTIDTFRADATGFSGNQRVETPFLDSLAARGIVFRNAHAQNVVTLPSHANILTGLYPFQHGIHENAGYTLDPKHLTIATMLRRHGWATGAFVGAFPLDKRFGLNQGFDVYDDNYGKGQATVDFVLQERPAGAVLDAAARWWSANAGRHRFMWIHVYDPHAPYAPPEPFATEYADNRYLGEVAYVDHALSQTLGPILAADPRALIIVTGDHGEALGDHGERTHGLFAYESTLKIPLVVAGAGLGHRVEDASVRHIDIVPTILAAAHVVLPEKLPGASLFSVAAPRDSYFESLSASLNRGWAPLTGIIHDKLKYIDLPIPELYDLDADPGELHNLRQDRRRAAEDAQRLLAPMLAQLHPEERTLTADAIAKLRSLGYVTGSAPRRERYTTDDDPKNLVDLDAKLHDSIDAFQRDDLPRALRLARELVAARPGMTAGRETLAFMLQESDRIDDAIREYETILEDPNADSGDRVQLALLLSESGRSAEAAKLLEPDARGSDADPDILNAYGVALADEGHLDEATAQFERVVSIDPNNAPALQNLGIVALRRGDVEGARRQLTRALDLNPRLPLALNTLGVVYARMNDYPSAVDSWRKAVEIDHRQYDALFNIGLVEGNAGHRDAARKALSEFVANAPRDRYAGDIETARRALAALARK